MFFGQFDGVVDVKRRLYRNNRQEPWNFIGSAFVTFVDEDKAEQVKVRTLGLLVDPSTTYPEI